MHPHPDTAYLVVVERQRQLRAEATRERLAAEAVAGRPRLSLAARGRHALGAVLLDLGRLLGGTLGVEPVPHPAAIADAAVGR